MPSLTAYDPLDSATLDPYLVLAQLREHAPVFWHESVRSLALTKYADCVDVLRDPEHFARDRRRAGERAEVQALVDDSVQFRR